MTRRRSPRRACYGPLLGGVAILALFGWYETKIEHPSLNVRLFKDARLSSSVGAVALVFFAFGGVFLFISLYLQNVRGYSPLQAGLLTLPLAVGQLLFSPRSAGLVAKHGAKVVCAAGLALVAVALLSYQFTAVHSSIWVLEVTFFIQGVGMALVMPPATTSIMAVLPREEAGSGSALNNIARQVSVALGVAILGSLVTSIYRNQMRSHLAFLKPQARSTAGESIGGTAGVAEHLGAAGKQIMDPARYAFVHAMHITSGISAGIAVLAVLVVLKWMPGKGTGKAEVSSPEHKAETAGV